MAASNYTRCTIASFDSFELETFQWSPPAEKPTIGRVLFVHGFAEHCARFDRQNTFWADAGIEVLAFDQRGFGQTRARDNAQWGKTSWPLQLGDIDFLLTSLLAKSPNVPVFLAGHSMGGGLALAYETRLEKLENSAKISGVISCSPCLTLPPQMAVSKATVIVGSLAGRLSASLPVVAVIDPTQSCRDPQEIQKVRDDPLMKLSGLNATARQMSHMLNGGKAMLESEWKRWPVSMPLLVLHGTSDFVTSYDSSKLFVENVQGLGVNAKLITYEGAYHELAREPEGIKEKFSQDTLDWMQERINNLSLLSTSSDFKSNI